MGWFQSKEEELAELRQDENAYAVAAQEIAGGVVRPGIWAKAVTDVNGDTQKAQDRYIKLRVSQVKLEESVAAAEDLRISKLPSPAYRCTACKNTEVSFWNGSCPKCSGSLESYRGPHTRVPR